MTDRRGWLIALGGAVVLLAVLLLMPATPTRVSRERLFEPGFHVTVTMVPDIARTPPTVSWAGSDSTKIFIGYFPGLTGQIAGPAPIGWVVDPVTGTRRRAEPADVPPLGADWLGPASVPAYPHADLFGVTLPGLRSFGNPMALGPTWEPYGFGYESIRTGSGATRRTLMQRWTWNSRSRLTGAGGIADRRGERIGFVTPVGRSWDVWIWPVKSIGGSHAETH